MIKNIKLRKIWGIVVGPMYVMLVAVKCSAAM